MTLNRLDRLWRISSDFAEDVVAITRSYVTLNQQAWSWYCQQKWYVEESAVNVSQLSVHVSLSLKALHRGWCLSPSCWEFWETADFCSVVWLTWLLQLHLNDFIFTCVTCPLVPLFQLPLYLLWHFVPNIILHGTTNLLHLLWFEKCSQNPSSQVLCGVFCRKRVFPLSSSISFLRRPFLSLTFHWTGKMIRGYLFHPDTSYPI